MEKIYELKDKIENLLVTAEKFYIKGNKTAGKVSRKTLQEIKRLAHILRQDISSVKNASKSTEA